MPEAEEEADLSLRVYIWGTDSSVEPRIERFSPTEWGPAIDRARELADGPERLSRIQVVDAWGMLIAQFCSRFIYMPKGHSDG